MTFAENGQIIRDPVGARDGYWVGAPGVYRASNEKTWYLTYRIRRPRGVPPDRGGETRIARSTDLAQWEDIWGIKKDALATASIERSAIRQGADHVWRYFISFVDPADGRWCVGVIRAERPDGFVIGRMEKILTAQSLGLEGVKDPWIMEGQGRFYMFLSVALATSKTNSQSHSTLDIYNTGECVSATGLAISEDLDRWKWQGIVFQPEPGNGWDSYCRRINSVIESKGRWIGFYDGSASHRENYEEKTGLAVSPDLKDWKTLTPRGPAQVSPFASHSLRYVDAQIGEREVLLFYEFARPDGAHDLRLSRIARTELDSVMEPASQQ